MQITSARLNNKPKAPKNTAQTKPKVGYRSPSGPRSFSHKHRSALRASLLKITKGYRQSVQQRIINNSTHLSNLHTYQLTHKNSACTKELGTTETLPNQHEQTIL